MGLLVSSVALAAAHHTWALPIAGRGSRRDWDWLLGRLLWLAFIEISIMALAGMIGAIIGRPPVH